MKPGKQAALMLFFPMISGKSLDGADENVTFDVEPYNGSIIHKGVWRKNCVNLITVRIPDVSFFAQN